ncbi:MAG: DNA polymerase IV [Candidatus Mcinerneyibacterium aminivorans]|uniref:DNA polymerase IV n=1 Tax=Candidatus Mcinerneyibacterium aminivorans TaxID=2703815 RepID=A0A5D0MBJ6_9BACT|nr:MAG: DNA polymerase IV [Candidatus Mcinerneyibacterium aminivorans]
MRKRTIVHVDMDAFFASIEQLDNPEYRDKPVIVGADPEKGNGRGVVSTCSYEAREYGIHSAMPISKAYRRCPDGIYVKPHFKRYEEISNQIMKIFNEFTPVIEKISIDEAFLDMTGCEHFYESVNDMGEKIKARIKKKTKLSASVGIASNKSIAKIASDLNKPDGLTICPYGQEKKFLSGLSLKKLWGVGDKTLKKLKKMGLKKVGDIAEIPKDIMKRKFGKHGVGLWKLANGKDDRDVTNYSKTKSISEECTFSEDVDNFDIIDSKIVSISDRVARRLRKKNFWAKTVFIKIRFENFTTYTRRKTLGEYFKDSSTLIEYARLLMQEFKNSNKKVRLIGVGVAKLKSKKKYRQMNLFDDNQTGSKVDKALDKAKKKFGDKINRGSDYSN